MSAASAHGSHGSLSVSCGVGEMARPLKGRLTTLNIKGTAVVLTLTVDTVTSVHGGGTAGTEKLLILRASYMDSDAAYEGGFDW